MLIAVNIHALVLIAILLGPRLPCVREMIEQRQKAIEEQARAELEKQRERERERARFVFVQPRLDKPSPKVSPRADLSDLDRRAQTVLRAERPTNPEPFARGNSPERLEATPPAAPPNLPRLNRHSRNDAESGRPPVPIPDAPDAPARPETRPTESTALALASLPTRSGTCGEYAQQENFGNLRGGDDQNFGESIQFDTKGVEFGPWLARFLAQVRANWMIPQAAMSMHGHRRDLSLSTRMGASPT